ncbi:MAG: selenium metabolism-associated LysR family transcriptional regulator [Desulfobacterales bacterium]
MDLWQLHIFCKVVESRSFSKAGKTVHLSQPTVSSHIRDLEEHFGCRLIDRLSKEVLPTKAGELLYDYARKLLSLRDETETALADFHGKVRGRLVIGGSTIPGVYILPKVVGHFVSRYPEVRISLRIGDTDSVAAAILSGEVELGIVGAKTGEKKIVQEKLLADRMRLIVPADHKWADQEKIEADMLLQEPFIVREPGSGTLKAIRTSLSRIGHDMEKLNITAEMGSTAAVIQGIKNHVGISFLSCMAVTDELRAGSLRALKVSGLDVKRNFYLSFCKDRTPSPLSQVFGRFLKEIVPKIRKTEL